jgi:hypothetical protein
MRKLLNCLTSIAIAAHTTAQGASFSYTPTQPTANQVVSVQFSDVVAYSGFYVGPHAVTISGNDVRIDGCIDGGGFAVPGIYTKTVRLPRLPAGQYRVNYYRTICARFAPPYQLVGTWSLVILAAAPGDVVEEAPAIDVREYWHRTFDHYFFTADQAEMLAIETGRFSGWQAPPSAGRGFATFIESALGRVPVCRFFSVAFAPKSSHFYAAGQAECDSVKSNADWTYEGVVGYVYATIGGGVCPQGLPLYRLYNNGQGGAPNHRYTVDAFVRLEMIQDGWIPEGLGIGVVACVPASISAESHL